MPIDIDYDKAWLSAADIASLGPLTRCLLFLTSIVLLSVQVETRLVELFLNLVCVVLVVKADCQEVALVAEFYGNDGRTRYFW